MHSAMYSIIDHTLKSQLQLDITDYIVMDCLYQLAVKEDRGGWITASRIEMAEFLGITRQTIGTSINRLQEKGYCSVKANMVFIEKPVFDLISASLLNFEHDVKSLTSVKLDSELKTGPLLKIEHRVKSLTPKKQTAKVPEKPVIIKKNEITVDPEPEIEIQKEKKEVNTYSNTNSNNYSNNNNILSGDTSTKVDKKEVPEKEEPTVDHPKKEETAADKLLSYVATMANVSKLSKQMTVAEAEKLLKKYRKDLIALTVGNMENTKGLTKKYTSVYLTLNRWCMMEFDRNPHKWAISVPKTVENHPPQIPAEKKMTESFFKNRKKPDEK